MKKILNIETVNEYDSLVSVETTHPLVNVINLSNTTPKKYTSVTALNFGFYAVFLKEDKQNCTLRYGRNKYDYQKGTLVFIAPGQVVSIEGDRDDYKPEGYVLLFDPELLRGTALAQKIKTYTYFSYEIHEALHLSTKEKEMVMDCLRKIEYELSYAIDKHSKQLIVSNIELFLNYCQRFFDRQFITRENSNKGILERFEKLLDEYFNSEELPNQGLPTVNYCSTELRLSSNYFSDLIKRETGKTAQEYIHFKLLDLAKERIFDTSKSIREIAYELGFKYPQHFTRFFKQHEGISPNEYRNLN